MLFKLLLPYLRFSWNTPQRLGDIFLERAMCCFARNKLLDFVVYVVVTIFLFLV